VNIVIIYQFFQSEDEPGHSLTYNLTQNLALKGNKVTVVCSKIGYMKGNTANLSFKQKLLQKTKVGPVEVIRIWSYLGLHSSYMGRIFNYISFSISSAIAMLLIKKPDVVLISSPPLFCAFTTGLVCLLRRIPFVLEVRDLWPTSLIELGAIKNSLIKSVMFLMERFLYNKAYKIITLTKGIKNYLLNIKIPAEKIAFIHCGVNLTKMYPDYNAGLSVRSQYGWGSKKVVMYFGALGEANNIDVIIRAAADLNYNKDIIFVIIGDGIRREKIIQDVANLKLENVLVLPALPKSEGRKFLSAADVCIVTLKDLKIFEGAIPTKLIDYMACARPVLCGVKGEAEEIIQDAKCGYVFNPNDEKQLVYFLLKILSNNEKSIEMGTNGYNYVVKNFTIEKMQEAFERVIKSVVIFSNY
jgi:glycosyltransferase involved in cell wall biosynthesis